MKISGLLNWRFKILVPALVYMLCSSQQLAAQSRADSLLIQQALQYNQNLNDSLLIVFDNLPKQDTMKVVILIDISKRYQSINIDSCLYYFEKALVLSESQQYQYGIAYASHFLGRLSLENGKGFEIAMPYLDRAYSIFEKLGNKNQMHFTNVSIAGAYVEVGHYEKALEISLDIIRNLDNIYDPEVGYLYNNTGALYYYLGDYDKAMEYYSKGLEQQDSSQGLCLMNIAEIYQDQKKYNEAIRYYMDAKQYLVEHDKTNKDLLFIYRKIGQISNTEGQLDQALEYYQQALEMAVRVKSQRSQANSHLDMAKVLLNLKHYKEAEYHAMQALKASKTFGSKEIEMTVNQLLSEIFSAQGDFRTAMQRYTESIAIKDSLKALNQAENIASLQLTFDVEKQKQKIKLLEADQKNKQLWLSAMIGGAIFLAAIAVLIYFLLSSRIKAKNSLIAHDKEVESIKSDFFLNIAHELRTPLTLIQGPLNELNSNQNLSDNQKRSFKRIKDNSQKLVTMAEEILQASKIESEEMQLDTVTVPFKSTIQQIFSAYELQAETKGIDYSYHDQIEDDFWFSIDKGKFIKILDVLISNALKYATTGASVQLIVSQKPKKGLLRFVVKDTGIGIDKKDISRIFQRYFQSGHAKQLKLGGVGVGLALAYKMAKLLGGDITVKSVLDQGSSFIVDLPKTVDLQKKVLPEKVKPAVSSTPESPIEPKAEKELQEAIKTTILIVDDHPDMLEYIKEIMQDDYQVVTAQNGEIALALLQSSPAKFDLVLSDITMPVMDGLELLKHIKSTEAIKQIPVVLITARAENENQFQAFSLGVSDYVTKPFVPSELKTICKYQLKIQAEKLKIAIQSAQPAAIPTEDWIHQIEQAVLVYRTEPIVDIEVISREMDQAPEELAMQLKQVSGLSLQAYFEEVKLQKLRHIIESDNYHSLDDLAEQFSFEKTSLLANRFKERFGIELELIG